MRTWSAALLLGLALLTLTPAGVAAERQALQLGACQKDHLWLEPVLVSLQVQGDRVARLPAGPGESKAGVELLSTGA